MASRSPRSINKRSGDDLVTELMKKNDKRPAPISKQWVLVMDDDAVMKAITCRMLEKSGYGVYLIGSSDDAVECYAMAEECGYPFCAVIMDTSVLSTIDCKEAITGLLAEDPDVRAIVMSGERDHPAVSNFREYGFKGALTKPFTINELGRSLQGAAKGPMSDIPYPRTSGQTGKERKNHVQD